MFKRDTLYVCIRVIRTKLVSEGRKREDCIKILSCYTNNLEVPASSFRRTHRKKYSAELISVSKEGRNHRKAFA